MKDLFDYDDVDFLFIPVNKQRVINFARWG